MAFFGFGKKHEEAPATAPVPGPAPHAPVHEPQVPSSEPPAANTDGNGIPVPGRTPGPASFDVGRPKLKIILKAQPTEEAPKPGIRLATMPMTPDAPIAAERPDLQRTDPKILYYKLMNGLYDAIFVLDDQGNVIDYNTRADEVFGYAAGEMWNLPISKIIYGMTVRTFTTLRGSVTEGRHVLLNARCVRSTGDLFLAEVGVSFLPLTRTGNLMFAVRNVERRSKAVEEELLSLHAAVDVAPFPQFVCNMHGVFQHLNAAALQALGVADAMEGRKHHLNELLPDMPDKLADALGGKDVDARTSLTRADGTKGELRLILKPIRKDKEIIGVAGCLVER